MIDHLGQPSNHIKVNYEEVLYLYRALRMNYEGRLQFHEAGDFHIGEMETRRLALLQDKSQNIVIRLFKYFFMWLYKMLSGYGERYLRAAGSFFVIVAVFAILFMATGLQKESDKSINKNNDNFVEDAISFSPDFGSSFAYSLSVATIFMKDKKYTFKDDGFSYCLFVVESCLGAILLPLLVLAVRRNFKRTEKENFYGS